MSEGVSTPERTIDGRAIYARAQELAFPRYPGTDGDRRAIEVVAEWFDTAGLEVSRETFTYDVRPAFRALRLLLLGSAALVALSAGLAEGVLPGPARPGVALVLLASAFTAGAVFLTWAPWLEGIYASDGPTATVNVVGRRKTEGAAGETGTTLILMAHHDSKSQSLTLPFRALSTLAAILGVLLLAAVELAVLVGAAPPAGWLLAASGAACLALVALSTLRSGNRSPGGVDNAGSVAILAELAAVLAAEVSPRVELVFLSPGAEEDHMVGAMRWLERHGADLAGRRVFAINLDGAGIPGRVVALERYGFGRRFSPRLAALARRTAGELELPVRGAMLPPAMGIDAIPFANRGIESLTLASGSLNAAVLAVHSANDCGENLDPQALADVARLTRTVVLNLAAGER